MISEMKKENMALFASGIITKSVSSSYIFKKPANTNKKLPLIVYLHPANMQNHHEEDDLLINHMPIRYRNVYYLHPLSSNFDIFKSDDVKYLIDKVCLENPNIDKTRIYAVGFSMGARCLWNLACDYPQLFAAMIPIAGYSCYLRAAQIAHIPTQTHHGIDDNVVPFDESLKMVKALNSYKKADHILYRYNGGHNLYYTVVNDSETWTWLFSQKRV